MTQITKVPGTRPLQVKLPHPGKRMEMEEGGGAEPGKQKHWTTGASQSQGWLWLSLPCIPGFASFWEE